MISPNPIHRCDLDGHRWVACTGGVECDACGQVNIRRAEILPSGIRWSYADTLFWASLIFLAASIVFCVLVYFACYA